MVHINPVACRLAILLPSLMGWLSCHSALAENANQKQAATIPALIEQLGDEAFARRQAAQQQLAKLGEKALAALAQAAVKHNDLEVRHRAGELLVPLFSSRVAPLIEQLGDDSFDRREDAQKQLVKIGPPALKALRRASIRSEDLEIRNRARKAIIAISGRPR